MSETAPLNDDERANLVAYLDGELPEAVAAEVEATIQRDPQVRSEADTLRKTWELLDYLPRPQPSASFTNRTLQKISAFHPKSVATPLSTRWRPWVLGVGWAALVLFASALGFAGGQRLQRVATPDEAASNADLYEMLVRDLRIVENLRVYEKADNLEFVQALDDPDLFGDDTP
jgi:anti-sigma factor RsiW